MIRKVVITGGLGFIGMHVAVRFALEGHGVLLLDNLSAQVHGAIPDASSLSLLNGQQVDIMRGDVRDSKDWAEALAEAQSVIHLAAETGTGQSMYEISRYAGTNVGGTAELLDYLANRKHSVRKVILASSRAVYGEGAYRCKGCGLVYPPARSAEALRASRWEPNCPNCGSEIQAAPTDEDGRTYPASVYAATKLAQENLVRITCRAHGIPFVIFRFQNVYGEGQSLRNPYTGILSIFSNQIRAGKTIRLYEDGHESRDFVHVSDVACAIALAIAGDGADGRTLNIGSGKATSVKQIAHMLGERLNIRHPPVISGEYRIGDIRHGYADIGALRAALGFSPAISLEDGLTRFTEWVEQQPLQPDRLDSVAMELVSRRLMPNDVQ